MERLTPLDIFNKDFKYSFRGYDVDEVNEFLDLVIKNFEYLIEENRELKEQLKTLRESVSQETGQEALLQDMLRRIERLEEKVRG
ncbi:DivIVA domain-containing protein [Novibacillus thermophilus]|jgi:DivIVA domain-containing protein|uniref:DivIVA domain-containing protein n=1 Tax=Novibacillus thermophilus TaxID=1471761 RepID=UPI000989BDE7|nr:DivIVA domain-containing protein [Novibacillus thermophilus]